MRQHAATEGPLTGRTVAFLEARRSEELRRLIEHQGGTAYIAPALREVTVEDDAEIRRWLDALTRDQFDVVLFLSGVGCSALLDRADGYGQLPAVLAALQRSRVVARGPKPVHVLKQAGVRIDFVPPEPNTSDELLAEFQRWELAGKTVGVQLYGGRTPFLDRLRDGLLGLGARLDEVSPYRWEGPSDEAPVRSLIAACLEGRVDALAILSSSQINNLFAIAEEHDQAGLVREALNQQRVLIAAVGPVSADAIRAHGVKVDLQPEHPKMGHLVLALAAALGPAPR